MSNGRAPSPQTNVTGPVGIRILQPGESHPHAEAVRAMIGYVLDPRRER